MSLEDNLNKILIIDFGSQFTQLIARRIRELGVYCELINHKQINKINHFGKIKGIILSGQIYEKNIFDREKALEKYMLILDKYPSSIFSEPIRYHIRELKQLES